MKSKMQIRKSADRGHFDHGWLKTYHTFSFGDYYEPQWMGFRHLRVINDDYIQPGMGFGMHAHRDMEIITYMLSGSLAHKDSMGNGRVIKTGEVQYMSAGTGVRHSEFNASAKEEAHLIQIWIEPNKKGVQPHYAEKSFANAAFGQLHLLTSVTGRNDSIAIHQDADLWLAKLNPGQTLTHTLVSGRYAWFHLAQGQVTVNGIMLQTGDAVAIQQAGLIEFKADASSQVLLFDLN